MSGWKKLCCYNLSCIYCHQKDYEGHFCIRACRSQGCCSSQSAIDLTIELMLHLCEITQRSCEDIMGRVWIALWIGFTFLEYIPSRRPEKSRILIEKTRHLRNKRSFERFSLISTSKIWAVITELNFTMSIRFYISFYNQADLCTSFGTIPTGL